MEGAGAVVLRGIAFFVTAGSEEGVLDGGFESDFAVIDHFRRRALLPARAVQRQCSMQRVYTLRDASARRASPGGC